VAALSDVGKRPSGRFLVGETDTPAVELWCDGACSGNGRESSAGGWAAVLISDRPVQGAEAPAAAGTLEREIKRLTEPGTVSIDLGNGRPMRAMAMWGNESPSTNNRMEMTGLLEGLRALKRPSRVQAHVDSSYLMKAFTDRWLDGWQRRGWVNSQKKPVANRDLWEELLVAVEPHQVEVTKVAWHSGVTLNELVDQLAVAAVRR
jgi:ribonuclease HI